MPKNMRIIVACEESQTMTKSLRSWGHQAYSCDILPASGGRQHLHFNSDIFDVPGIDVPGSWDALIGFPPCTYLCKAQQFMYKDEQRARARDKSLDFVRRLYDLPIPIIILENPIGYLNTNWKKPNVIISPHLFGDEYKKDICLWSRGIDLKALSPGPSWGQSDRHKNGKKYKSVENHKNSRMTKEQVSIIKSSWKYYPNMVEALGKYITEYQIKPR